MKGQRIIITIIFFLLIMLTNNENPFNRSTPVITYITGLWDIKRVSLDSKFKRSFDYYLNFFKQLLQTESNLIIFGDSQLQDFVAANRKKNNTIFILRDLQWFRNRWYSPHIKRIVEKVKRQDPQTFKIISAYPQYALQLYDPVVMSKVFLMEEAMDYDTFNSDHYVWLDGGFTHVYDKKHIVQKDNVFQRIPLYFQGPIFFHTNHANQLQYGYAQQGLGYLQNLITQFVWANFFGGRIEAISSFSFIYENIMRVTLENSDLWTQQSLFSLMINRYPYFAVALFNISLDDFDYFRFNYPRYQKTEQIRHFNISSLSNSMHCSQNLVQNSVVIIKDSRNSSAFKQLLEHHYFIQALDDNIEFYHERFALYIRHIVKLGVINLIFFFIYIYVRCKIRKQERVLNQIAQQTFL